jgi:hypothetical protein
MKTDPDKAGAIDALRGLVQGSGSTADPKAWARRELACERLSRYQREAWREALGVHSPEESDVSIKSTT